MSGPEWPPVLTKGSFSLVVKLGHFPNYGPRGDETCCAIGVCDPEGDDPTAIGFRDLSLVGEFCQEMAPHLLGVFNADGTKNVDLFDRLRICATGGRLFNA